MRLKKFKRGMQKLFGKEDPVEVRSATIGTPVKELEDRFGVSVESPEAGRQIALDFTDKILRSGQARRRTPEEEQKILDAQAAEPNHYEGSIHVRNLMPFDLAYLYFKHMQFKDLTQSKRDLYFSEGLLTGSVNEINEAINFGFEFIKFYNPRQDLEQYFGALRPYVDAIFAKYSGAQAPQN